MSICLHRLAVLFPMSQGNLPKRRAREGTLLQHITA